MSPRKKPPEPSHLTDRFPELDEEDRGKVLYFDELDALGIEFLKGRGYVPKILAALPRKTPADQQEYLKAYGQGLLEGTISPPKNMATILKTMFDEAGLLGKRDREKEARSPEMAAAMEDALNWAKSRYTMDNSTHGSGKKDPGKEQT